MDAGYEYLNLDDYWGVRNNETNHIEADAKRFPSGMKSLVSKIHKLGFKLGIYTDMGSNGCHHPFTGSWPFYYQDAIDSYRQGIEEFWGFDQLNIDDCHDEVERLMEVRGWEIHCKSPMIGLVNSRTQASILYNPLTFKVVIAAF